jgi:hypothetical protein
MINVLIGWILEKSVKKGVKERNEQITKEYNCVLDLVNYYNKKYPDVNFTMLSRLEPITENTCYIIEVTSVCIINPLDIYRDPSNPKDYRRSTQQFIIRASLSSRDNKKYYLFFTIFETIGSRVNWEAVNNNFEEVYSKLKRGVK